MEKEREARGSSAHVHVLYISTEDKKALRQEAETIAKTMNLSVVRLCFQVSPVSVWVSTFTTIVHLNPLL